MSCLSCADGLETSNRFFAPFEYVRQNYLGNFYKNNPTMSRVVVSTAYTISGFVKPILFPFWALIGVIALPIIAAVSQCRTGDGKRFIKAWGFSILGLVGTVAYVALATYYLPLFASSAMFMTALVISVVIHVRYAVQAPPVKPSIVPPVQPDLPPVT